MYTTMSVAGWGDMDFNSHMRNTAFLNRAADVRMIYFAESGFPMQEFLSRRIGPVIMKDEVEYFREVTLLQEISVHVGYGGPGPGWFTISHAQRCSKHRRQALRPRDERRRLDRSGRSKACRSST